MLCPTPFARSHADLTQMRVSCPERSGADRSLASTICTENVSVAQLQKHVPFLLIDLFDARASFTRTMDWRTTNLVGAVSLLFAACGGDEASPGSQCTGNELSVPGQVNDPCPQDSPMCVAAGGKAYATCMDGAWSKKCECVTSSSGVPMTNSMSSPVTTTPSTPVTNTMSRPPMAAAVCGDGQITAPTEACDKMNLNGASCQSLGFTGGGTLLCSPTTCSYDTTMCRMTMATGSGAGTSGGAGMGGGGTGR